MKKEVNEVLLNDLERINKRWEKQQRKQEREAALGPLFTTLSVVFGLVVGILFFPFFLVLGAVKKSK